MSWWKEGGLDERGTRRMIRKEDEMDFMGLEFK
ncbi:hypothetical protein B2K_39510 [Paenibacillus mucilaginosus K02]|uniref:Uncharacterized protein n=1 Tax=Paenibacillus mucilaginosus K02 TaxID=997761 RepID=R9UPX8_9BACL|nr:hypothetical protein B2K_39510 [Paenibacillus mucilaginosus K02]